MNKLLILLISLLFILQFLDFYTTYIGVKMGASEINEFAKKISGYKLSKFLWIKMASTLFSICLLYLGYRLIYKRWSTTYLLILLGIIIYLAYVVVKNSIIIMRLKA